MGDWDGSGDDSETDPSSADGDDSQSSDEPLAPGEIFDLLADERDRFVLYLLAERGGTVATADLSRATAAWEYCKKPEHVSRQTTREISRRLHHVSLPRLEELGIVTTSEEPKAVTLTARGDQLEPYLDFAMGREHRDVDCYLEAAG